MAHVVQNQMEAAYVRSDPVARLRRLMGYWMHCLERAAAVADGVVAGLKFPHTIGATALPGPSDCELPTRGTLKCRALESPGRGGQAREPLDFERRPRAAASGPPEG